MRRIITIGTLAVALLAAGGLAYRGYLIHELRKPVIAHLNDPDSAQFRDEKLFSGWTIEQSALCGEVNAKNRMGGYVGYAPFTVVAGIAHISDAFESDFKRLSGLPICSLEQTPLPWWHIRW